MTLAAELAIIERPDYRLDERILRELGYTPFRVPMDSDIYWAIDGDATTGLSSKAEAPTASTENAFELMTVLFPDANFYGTEFNGVLDQWNAYISRNQVNEGHWFSEGWAKTSSAAICIAILTRAKSIKSN
jgi:hypothetical protein